MAERRPHLVIAPVSVLENWQRELALWAPALRVACLHGASRGATRERIRHQARAGLPQPFDVLLVSESTPLSLHKSRAHTELLPGQPQPLWVTALSLSRFVSGAVSSAEE